MRGQFLTAMFELRTSRRKAAALERVRVMAECVFWAAMESLRDRSRALTEISDSKARREAGAVLKTEIGRQILAASTKAGLSEPVAQGLVRDVQMAVGSYIELRAGGHEAEWPEPVSATAPDHAGSLELLATSSTKDHEDEARDTLATVAHGPAVRPLTLTRARDGLIVRTGPDGAMAAVLNVLRASDLQARPARIAAGLDASTGEEVRAQELKTRLVIPLSCSKWHEQKFLGGAGTLRSSIIARRDDRWFMCAQFEMPVAKVPMMGARLGIDRGIVNPVAMAVVAKDGAVRSVPEPVGSEIGAAIVAAEQRRKAEQKRRGVTSHRHIGRVDNALHVIANRIVAEAKAFGAAVVVEKLDGLKRGIVEKRPRGSRKGGWRKLLKRAQIGKLEAILAYKLKLAGIPVPCDVVAGGTSQTCPACGLRDPKSRLEQSRFACVGCGFTGPADPIASVNIARRGIAIETITKGGKVTPIEQDMVARLRLYDDSGLGPLAAGLVAASGFVAGRASADSVYEGALYPLTVTAGQNCRSHVIQNANDGVIPEGGVGTCSLMREMQHEDRAPSMRTQLPQSRQQLLRL